MATIRHNAVVMGVCSMLTEVPGGHDAIYAQHRSLLCAYCNVAPGGGCTVAAPPLGCAQAPRALQQASCLAAPLHQLCVDLPVKLAHSWLRVLQAPAWCLLAVGRVAELAELAGWLRWSPSQQCKAAAPTVSAQSSPSCQFRATAVPCTGAAGTAASARSQSQTHRSNVTPHSAALGSMLEFCALPHPALKFDS